MRLLLPGVRRPAQDGDVPGGPGGRVGDARAGTERTILIHDRGSERLGGVSKIFLGGEQFF